MPSPQAADAPAEITALLRAWSLGDAEALEQLVALVYDDLRRIARQRLAKERPGHTLQPTALVHEAYLRLGDHGGLRWQNRAHFFAIAATTMRRILVEHARSHGAAKRGHGRPALPLVELSGLGFERPAELVALDDCLTALARSDPLKASIVELRFFGGLTVEETAEVAGCSRATVIRHWRMARAWLFHELSGGDEAT